MISSQSTPSGLRAQLRANREEFKAMNAADASLSELIKAESKGHAKLSDLVTMTGISRTQFVRWYEAEKIEPIRLMCKGCIYEHIKEQFKD